MEDVHPRALADDGSDSSLSVWFGVAIAALTALTITLGLALFAYLRTQTRPPRHVQKVMAETNCSTKEAWPDLEKADQKSNLDNIHQKQVPVQDNHSNGNCKGLPSVPREVCETLRRLLEEEIARGLQREGISERLDRLERKEEMSESLERASMNDRIDRLERQSLLNVPRGPPSLRDAAALPDELAPQADTVEKPTTPKARKPSSGCAPGAEFGPTLRQLNLPDPPEPARQDIQEDSSLKVSLFTVQRSLNKRNVQTQELKRQLTECQKALWQQSFEARTTSKQLKDVLSDPSLAPKAQAEELKKLRQQIEELSSRLANAKSDATHWSSIAKQQRVFFHQTEIIAQEGPQLVKRHPCGEIFLAHPPICLEGEEEESTNSHFDVGTAEMNPYTTDSWPFEPNVLARKASAEPNLNRLDEDEEQMSDFESEEGPANYGGQSSSSSCGQASSSSSGRAKLEIRLPGPPDDIRQAMERVTPPPSTPPPPEPCGQPQPLLNEHEMERMPSETARSV